MRCTFKQGKFNCGSYAFNLYKEQIDQGDRCDHHYWQDQAQKARADEREACAKVAEEVGQHKNQHGIAAAIRARGNK
jgi:hypothetical protein